MSDVLYRWPDAALVNSRVPKDKLYEHGKASTSVREAFVSEVARITWAFKLAESTINLPPSSDVAEIQVFRLDARGDDVSDRVLATIDKAIPHPIIFEIRRTLAGASEVRVAACIKPGTASATASRAYYSTSWQPCDTERVALPIAITLPALYSTLLAPLLPLEPRTGESLPTTAMRLDAARRLEREIGTLERRIRAEPQLNRKVEMRRELKNKQRELEEMR